MSTKTLVTTATVTVWVESYVKAWISASPKDIRALFSADGEYHEQPYETAWIGREAIVEGWLSRQGWQEGGWTFDWEILMITGDTAVVRGTGSYTELGTFENLWVLTLDPKGRCSMFRMWNNEVHADPQ